MKYALLVSAALLVGAGALAPAQAQQGIDLVKQAVAAQGGAEALRSLKAVGIKAHGQHWEPGQSYAPGGEARFLGDSDITVTWDLANDAARTAWDRSMKYPAVETLKYTEVVRPDVGMVVNDKGTQPMSGIRVAASLRELERASPALLLHALDAPKNVAALPDQKLGEITLSGGRDHRARHDLHGPVRSRDAPAGRRAHARRRPRLRRFQLRHGDGRLARRRRRQDRPRAVLPAQRACRCRSSPIRA